MALNTLVLDYGNYDIKYSINGEAPKDIRSQRFTLPAGINPMRPTDKSPLVEVDGIRYHYGHKVSEYRKQEQTVHTAKELSIYPAALACLGVIDGKADYKVKVVTSHPKSEQVSAIIRERLLGQRMYQHNYQNICSEVVEVEVYPEGYGAYLWAKQNNLVPSDGYTVLIDIGGGTWLSRLFNEDGDIIASTVSEKGGAFDLAQSIAFDGRLRSQLQDRPQPAVIMDGFANQTNCYGRLPVSWADWMGEYVRPWFSAIIGEVKSEYAPYFGYVRKFLLNGGSSLLVSDLVQNIPLFSHVPDARHANVLGLNSMLGGHHENTKTLMTSNGRH